jgi:hypothetical protein
MSGNNSQNTLSWRLKSKLRPASCLFSYSDDSILPRVGLFSIWQHKTATILRQMPKVLNTLCIKTTVLCDTMPYSLAERYYLGGICCLQLQQKNGSQDEIGSFATSIKVLSSSRRLQSWTMFDCHWRLIFTVVPKDSNHVFFYLPGHFIFVVCC